MESKFIRRQTPSPSFNRGWRFGVAVGGAIVLLVLAASIGSLVIGVWNVY